MGLDKLPAQSLRKGDVIRVGPSRLRVTREPYFADGGTDAITGRPIGMTWHVPIGSGEVLKVSPGKRLLVERAA